jgi:hypothetical protein
MPSWGPQHRAGCQVALGHSGLPFSSQVLHFPLCPCGLWRVPEHLMLGQEGSKWDLGQSPQGHRPRIRMECVGHSILGCHLFLSLRDGGGVTPLYQGGHAVPWNIAWSGLTGCWRALPQSCYGLSAAPEVGVVRRAEGSFLHPMSLLGHGAATLTYCQRHCLGTDQELTLTCPPLPGPMAAGTSCSWPGSSFRLTVRGGLSES